MRRRGIWALFIALGFLWGSSYLWIKIGLESLPPMTLIAARLTVGGLFLATVVAASRQSLPRQPRMYGHLLVMAVVNIVLPFTLIAIGEQSIDSALASILNATVPLAVIVIAPMFLPDERITLARVAGLAVGFAGVVLLVAPDLVNLGDANPTGELLMIGSSLSYAVGNVYARRNVHGLPPMIPALFQVAFAAAIVIPIALLVDRPFATVTPEPSSIAAVLWLGLLGSGLAYICLLHDPAGVGRHPDLDGGLPAAGRRDRPRRGRAERPRHRQPDRWHGADHRRHRARQQRPGACAG